MFGNGKSTIFNNYDATKTELDTVENSFYSDMFRFEIKAEPNLKKISRKTDSILEWLGEWGGLLDALNFLGKHLLSSYTSYNLQNSLALLLVRFIPSNKSDESSLRKKDEKEKVYKQKYLD